MVERARTTSLQDLIVSSVENIRRFGLTNPLQGLNLQDIKNYIGREFVPLYQICGPLVIFGLCICGMIGICVRILEAIFASVVIARTRGCGWRVLTGLFGKVALIPLLPIKYIVDNSSLRAEFLKAVTTPNTNADTTNSESHKDDLLVPEAVLTHPTYQPNLEYGNRGLEGPSDWPMAALPCCEKQTLGLAIDAATHDIARTLPATVLMQGSAIDNCNEAIIALRRDMRRSGILPTEVDPEPPLPPVKGR